MNAFSGPCGLSCGDSCAGCWCGVQVPALAYNVAYAVNSSYVRTSPGYVVLSHVRNLLVNVNSAVNFSLYCAVGQKFRRVFLETFAHLAPCWRRDAANRPPTVVMTDVDGNRRTLCRGQLGRVASARMHVVSDSDDRQHCRTPTRLSSLW